MLFEPFAFSKLTLKNRMVRSATYEKRADIDGFVNDDVLGMYEELARGGVGLIITGNVLVHVAGRTVPQMLCIHTNHYVDGLKRLTDAVHELDGLIAIQLVHGGRQCFPSLLGGDTPLAPSEVHDPSIKVTPRAMTSEEIWETIEAFGDAARRAQDAGFDAIQIHGAHGYLVSQFLSPHTNRRDDYWGGDEERRFHFAEEVIKAMREEVGDTIPLMVKMNADDCLEGGLKPEEGARIARRYEYLGISAIEVSGGMYEAGSKTTRTNIPGPEQEAYFREASALVKNSVSVPIILVGGMRSKAVAEDVLLKGDADMVSFARPLIREPDLPLKFRQGKDKADCISCNGCMKFLKLDKVKCVQLNK
jgi:2,4-dienoyl-CoA reductase-like NADH-dependent reductase (Old Yellow Enzyme family)